MRRTRLFCRCYYCPYKSVKYEYVKMHLEYQHPYADVHGILEYWTPPRSERAILDGSLTEALADLEQQRHG